MGDSNDIAKLLGSLPELQGIDFIRQLKLITERREFFPLQSDPQIHTVGGENSEDYLSLLNVARKAVIHGFHIFILPNPKGIKTADFIFVRKGVYRMYELKTISGKTSAINRLTDSIQQTNRVLLNMVADYNPSSLARSIKRYFELNPQAIEVLVFKGNKQLSVTRKSIDDPKFFRTFINRYKK